MSIRKVVPLDDAEWRIGPPPDWVERREPDWGFAGSDRHAAAFLLVDEQHDVATESTYVRSVRRLLNLAAVQALSQVEIEFDASAHRAVIHELALWRCGEDAAWTKHTAARREDLLLRQREQQLEQQMLNGRVSLVALLEDVRVGDAIDLAWTLEPRERLPGMRFGTFFAFGWNAPVARASLSLRLDPAAPVTWVVHAPEDAARPVETAGSGSVRWEVENPPILEVEPNAPASSWPCPVVDASGWSGWAEVARFFEALWRDALAEGAEAIANEAQRLRSEFEGDRLVREAIRFVQEDVRYLSVDFGHGAGMLPSGAGTVLRRRFGDCKDKSVLLAALLRSLGYEAWPMLVAANWRTAISRTQPSASVFSHAIVGFTAEGRRCYVDPTFVGQRGDLDHLAPPPYGRGLEVREGAESLTTLPEPPLAELSVLETFELDRKQQQGSVEQVMRAKGPMADDVRAALVREGASAFARARGEGLQSHFPALVLSEAPAVVDDDCDGNAIEVRVRHALPTWGPTGQKAPSAFSYGAHGLFYAVEATEGPDQRKQPWALRHPLRAHHRVVVRGHCVRRVKPEKHLFSAPGFRYACDVTSATREVTFDYSWETTQAEVSPEEWPEYCRGRSEALARAGANVATNRVVPLWQYALIVPLGLAVGFGLGYLKDLRSEKGAATREADRLDRQQVADSMKAASRAMGAGDFAVAASLLRELAPYYDGDAGFHVMRAEAALRTGLLDEARQAIAAARRLDPEDPRPLLQGARLAELDGDLSAARRGAEQALARHPDDLPALWLAARSAEQTGDTAGALRFFERILAVRPAQPDALLHYALLLWNQGDRTRADSVIRGVVEAQPTASPLLELALSSYLDATGRSQEAVAPAARAAALAPEEPRFAHQHTMALLRAGNEEEAFVAAERAAERFPGDPLALNALAVVASKTGRTGIAETAFEKWLAAEPGNPNAAANYGYFLHETGRSEQARASLERATRAFPGSGIVWLNYATVLSALGDEREAAVARRKADALIPSRQRATLVR